MPDNIKDHSRHSAYSRASGVKPTLVLKFISTSFIYLLAGLVILLFTLVGSIEIRRDAIFILWLMGFVAMIIFGLSYMFSSGLSRSSAMINSTVNKEYALLNAGIIGFFLGFTGIIPDVYGRIFAICGLLLLIISVSIHVVNLILIAVPKKKPNLANRSYEDDY